jgi:LmbE family N-acetylglucosaminyl deacetylase
MGQIRSVSDIQHLGTIMGVWAHPDDETFTSAGIMAAAVKNGQTVVCLTATKGEAGVQDSVQWPADKLPDIRAQELDDALAIIGVQYHHWLEYKDGCCCEANHHEAIACICRYIDRYCPDTILTFGPDGITGHSDHQTVCSWATKACTHSTQKPRVYYAVHTKQQYDPHLKSMDDTLNIFFNIDEPPIIDDELCDIRFVLSPELMDIKCRALKAMPSQTSQMFKHFNPEAIGRALNPEAFIKAV